MELGLRRSVGEELSTCGVDFETDVVLEVRDELQVGWRQCCDWGNLLVYASWKSTDIERVLHGLEIGRLNRRFAAIDVKEFG
jgi:hypothetical protein